MGEAAVVISARSLKSIISEHRRHGEENAALCSPVVKTVGEAGLFRMFAPKEVGGLEVSPPDAFRATVEISAADPAVGWYMVNSMPACMLAAALPEAERKNLFVEPHRNFGFSAVVLAKATPVDGGYQLNGSWPMVTGCNDAKWCALAATVVNADGPRSLSDGRPEVRIFLVPTERLEITQTWQQAAAMRGTGSNQATAKNVFVPQVLALAPGTAPFIDRPLFRNSATLLTLPIFAAVAVGILHGAIDAASHEIKSTVSSRTGNALKDQAETQVAIADASAAVRAIGAACIETFDEIWQGLKSGEPISNQLKADMYSSSFYAGDVARQMISQLFTKGSRAAFMQGHALERCLANIHAVVAAIDARRGIHLSAGAVMLGGEPFEATF